MKTYEVDISVYMLTYFHEKYVAQAIESVLKQKTHFSYEIVISDDCSRDNTCNIIENYRSQYPEKIRVIYNKKNIGIPKNIFQARCSCRGKYIVVLSGDDYWINDLKLEIQGNFLEEHPEYIAVFNGIELRYNDEVAPFDIVPQKNERDKEFTINDYEKGGILRSHGFMMRNLFLNQKDREYFKLAQTFSDKIDDAVDMVLLLKRGRVFIIDAITDAHRIVKNEKEKRYNYNSIYNRFQKYYNYVQAISNLDNYINADNIEVSFEKKYIGILARAELDTLITLQLKKYGEVFRLVPSRYKHPFYKNVFVKTIPEIFRIILDKLTVIIKS